MYLLYISVQNMCKSFRKALGIIICHQSISKEGNVCRYTRELLLSELYMNELGGMGGLEMEIS